MKANKTGRERLVTGEETELEKKALLSALPLSTAPNVQEIAKTAASLTDDLISPRGIWKLAETSEVPPALVNDLTLNPAVTPHLLLSAASIGKDLQRKTKEVQREGHLAMAYMLDFLGSAAVMKTSVKTLERAQTEMEKEFHLNLFDRPGMGFHELSLEGKKAFLNHLNSGRIGVDINLDGVMIPGKSLACIYEATDSSLEEGRGIHRVPCRQCATTECRFREFAQRDL